MAAGQDRGFAGIGLGGVLVIVGIVVAVVWSLWIGIVIAPMGFAARAKQHARHVPARGDRPGWEVHMLTSGRSPQH